MASAPSHSIHASFSHGGHGAARCHTTFNDDTSYRSRTSAGSFEMRAIIVGTTYIESGCQRSINCSVVSASKRPPSTTWLPARSAVIVQTNGPLWYSGPGIMCVPSICISNSGLMSGSMRPGPPARISFGRPVLPPEVIALNGFATASGSGPSSTLASGAQPGGRHARSGWSAGSTPTMTRGFASSTSASSSRFGRREETGCGVAPSFQHATTIATNSTLFGSAIVTKSPCSTPRLASSRAIWLASRSSSPRVSDRCSSVTARCSGSRAAWSAMRCAYEIRAMPGF